MAYLPRIASRIPGKREKRQIDRDPSESLEAILEEQATQETRYDKDGLPIRDPELREAYDQIAKAKGESVRSEWEDLEGHKKEIESLIEESEPSTLSVCYEMIKRNMKNATVSAGKGMLKAGEKTGKAAAHGTIIAGKAMTKGLMATGYGIGVAINYTTYCIVGYLLPDDITKRWMKDKDYRYCVWLGSSLMESIGGFVGSLGALVGELDGDWNLVFPALLLDGIGRMIYAFKKNDTDFLPGSIYTEFPYLLGKKMCNGAASTYRKTTDGIKAKMHGLSDAFQQTRKEMYEQRKQKRIAEYISKKPEGQ